MVELAGSLYLVSTAVFNIVAGIVAVRLLLLARSSGQRAEALLGAGIGLTATLGYGIMIFSMIARRLTADPANAPAIYTALTTLGWVAHNLGVMSMLAFVVHVFRPGIAWAGHLAGAMALVMWVGWSLYVYQGGMKGGGQTSGYWLSFTVIGTYPVWTGLEAGRYYAQMRRRVALGLADGLVANRFLLWALASASAHRPTSRPRR